MSNENNNEKQSSGSLGMQVYEQLEAQILANKIKPGESLVEMKISQELGVSRTPVREAIRMLEQRGLVEVVPHKGAVVCGIDEKDLHDIYTIRSYIEGLAARWAAEHITKEQLIDLEEIVDLQEFYLLKKAYARISDLDSRFHERLYLYSGSRMLRRTLTQLHHVILTFRELSLSQEGRAEKTIVEHRQILQALAQHDVILAEKLMEDHIKNAKESILNGIDGGILKRKSD